jgi:hypothetical protein
LVFSDGICSTYSVVSNFSMVRSGSSQFIGWHAVRHCRLSAQACTTLYFVNSQEKIRVAINGHLVIVRMKESVGFLLCLHCIKKRRLETSSQLPKQRCFFTLPSFSFPPTLHRVMGNP